jgi:hypothetical protein
VPAIPADRLRRLRLAAQRLAPGAGAPDPLAATRAVVGIQAQDIRAAGLSLRSRVPGLTRAAVDEAGGLIRTWTFRGTVHLIAADDRPWIHALTGARNAARFESWIIKRGELDLFRELCPELVARVEERALSKADLLESLAGDGLPVPRTSATNVLMPWLAAQGLVVGRPDGRFHAADPPAPVDSEQALTTLAARYLAGHAPAGAPDLARWSGLPLGMARTALASIETEEAGNGLLVPPGALDVDPPPAPPALLLAGFDTAMLGWRTREPLVAAGDDRRILPGGGIVRAAVLTRGRATGTWRLIGSGSRRRLAVEWFGRRPPARARPAEAADAARFLGVELAA